MQNNVKSLKYCLSIFMIYVLIFIINLHTDTEPATCFSYPQLW